MIPLIEELYLMADKEKRLKGVEASGWRKKVWLRRGTKIRRKTTTTKRRKKTKGKTKSRRRRRRTTTTTEEEKEEKE